MRLSPAPSHPFISITMDLKDIVELIAAMWAKPGAQPQILDLPYARNCLRGATTNLKESEQLLGAIMKHAKHSSLPEVYTMADLRRALELIAKAQSSKDFTISSLGDPEFLGTAFFHCIESVPHAYPARTQTEEIKFEHFGLPQPPLEKVRAYMAMQLSVPGTEGLLF